MCSSDLKALKCLISYLYTTQNCWLMFSSKNAKILMYTDADYTQQADRHSILGYCLIFGAGAISQSSKKQNIVTLSSTEAKYIGHTNAVKEILWIQNFWAKINGKSIFDLTLLRADNQGAIQLSNNNKFHARTKHIDVHYHFIARHSKINSWKLNMFLLTKILQIYSPNHFPGHFLRSLGKC